MDQNAARAARRAVEWPTLGMISACYALWVLGLAAAAQGFLICGLVLLVAAVAMHSSLQHEVLHGHPTRSPALNELLVALPLGLAVPYRRFRDLHLRHHDNTRLTDPYDDPETFYLARGRHEGLPRLMRAALAFNNTLAGRMLIGPALACYAFWHEEARRLRRSREVRRAWALHVAGLAVLVAILLAAGAVPLWLYAAGVAYPAMSVLMVRTFAEHDAREDVAHRTAIVERGSLLGVLFLNNHLHYVHHRFPRIPWYRLPALYRSQGGKLREENGDHVYSGYGEIFRRFLFRARGPVVHPFLKTD
ncbi:MAG: fatty acid desaturase [Flavobacteriaceae bacterium]